MITQAEGAAALMGGSLSALLGVSEMEVMLLKLAFGMRIWFLVFGGISMIVGLAIHFLVQDISAEVESKKAKPVKISDVPTAVRKPEKSAKDVTPDTKNAKCPKCGKTYDGKVVFCSDCGEKLVKPETVVRPEPPKAKVKTKCPKCGKVCAEKVAFCSECGCKIPAEEPAENRCSKCGTVAAAGAKFCMKCGNALTAVSASADVSAGDSARKTVTAVTPVVVPEKPKATVVTEKKNPFMNKPTEL